MTWKLWLDDQVNDLDTPMRHCPEGYLGAESFSQAQDLVKKHGPPDHMDLDHDLGENLPTGMDFLKWMSEEHFDSPPLTWKIHSANPVGAANMDAFLRSWTWARVMEKVLSE